MNLEVARSRTEARGHCACGSERLGSLTAVLVDNLSTRIGWPGGLHHLPTERCHPQDD